MHHRIAINVLSLEPAPFGLQVDLVARLGAPAITPDVGQLSNVTSAQAGQMLHDAGVACAALTHRSFAFADDAQTREACERLNRSIAIAADLGASCIVLTTGGRGTLDWNDAALRFADGIAPCAALARSAGIILGIEPTSHLYADASIVHRLSDCASLARAADIGVVGDLFACWTDADLSEAIAASGPLTALVQVSDYVPGDRGLPCRAVPGDGAVPLDRLIPATLQAGFAGYFDLEIIGPRLLAEGVAAGLQRAAGFVGRILDEAGVRSA